jgi:hypothetical protein
MKPLFELSILPSLKSKTLVHLECYQCSKPFNALAKEVKKCVNGHSRIRLKYCSKECQYNAQLKQIEIECKNCGTFFKRCEKEIKKYKNNFCSKSCNAKYGNAHKSTGSRRSKLEVWTEKKLLEKYPNIKFQFNKTDAIGMELDIYSPDLNIAFELNGVFHYEPIYGLEKLDKIQERDCSKSKACHDAKIDLCVIDVSQQKYFKESTSVKYLNIICGIIDARLKN